MNVRFNIKDRGGLILLKFRYTRGGLPFVYSTRQHIKPKFWSKKTMRAILRNPAVEVHLVDLNGLLQRMEDEVLSVYRASLGNVVMDRALFKDHLDNTFFPAREKRLTIISYLNDEMQQLKRADETLANYRHVANVLYSFQKERKKEISFDALGFEWVEAFKKWCYSKDYGSGSVGKFVSIIKAAVNHAREMGLTEAKVDGRGFSVPAVKGNKLTLWPEELEQLAAFDFMAVDSYDGITGETMQRAADIIIAGCSTGLRHSDLPKLRRENIKPFRNRELIEVWTQKTDKLVAIPMRPELKALMEKYDGELPTMSRSWLMRAGRAALECAGIDRMVTVRDTKGGKVNFEQVMICKKFSAHMTRRTFATDAYLTDPALLPAIRAILGHSTDAQTLAYINVEDRLSAEHFAKRVDMQPKILKAIK